MSDEEEEFQCASRAAPSRPTARAHSPNTRRHVPSADSDEEQADVDADAVTVRAENAYYQAKGQRADDAAGARAGFASVLALEREAAAGGGGEDLSEWAFKAIKQLVKMDFRAGDFAAMLANYRCARARAERGAPPHAPTSRSPRRAAPLPHEAASSSSASRRTR
jgi:hypothetical protein